MFQLTDEEVKYLRWNSCTSNEEEDSNSNESEKQEVLGVEKPDGNRHRIGEGA